MAASPQKKFDAAVKVIRGLPKNGSFQPSNELMLKFYAYYKQATEGPCTSLKPGIWNLVLRRKWEAWSDLGKMEKDAAMTHYVEELKHIVEAMPQTEQVADFVQTLGSFYVVVEEGTDVCPALPPPPPPHTNGALEPNGTDKENVDETEVSEELRLRLDKVKWGRENGGGRSGDEGDNSHASRLPAPTGTTANGHKESTAEEDMDEDDDDEENDNHIDGTPSDSGSEGEFCDTSDHVEQANTSTPAWPRGETRVRFAPDVSVAEDSVMSVYEGGSDGSLALRDMSVLSSQMETERLRLWTDNEFSFLPQLSELPAHQRSESLHVNASFSSLVSLAGSENVADSGRDTDFLEDSAVEVEDVSRGWERRVRKRRGEEGRGGRRNPPIREQVMRLPPTAGSAHSSSSSGVGGRRALVPSGSGGGGEDDRGQGRRGQGCEADSLDEQILLTLLHLQQNMITLSYRLTALETSVKELREEQVKKDQNSKG
ncbi:hypothetical protein ACOMHN_018493 [Nucella lapillus]